MLTPPCTIYFIGESVWIGGERYTLLSYLDWREMWLCESVDGSRRIFHHTQFEQRP